MISPQRTQGNAEENLDSLTGIIINAAMKVHSALGPGLLESAYEACLKYELSKRCLVVESQVLLPVLYEGVRIDAGYRIDLLVENEIILELKAVEKVIPVHEAQLLSYLKLSNKQVGLLLNFNVLRLKDGITRVVSGYRLPPRPSASSAVS
jgi:GxxExxY protein